MARKPLYGQKGYGKFTCGNCKWFRTPRNWGKKGLGPCEDINNIAPTQKPCPAKQKGYGWFEPVDEGAAVDVDLSTFKQDDIELLRVKAAIRTDELEKEDLVSLHIGQHVKFLHGGDEYMGEVCGLTKTHVTVKAGATTWKLLPKSIKKAA